MSLETALARVSQLNAFLAPPAVQPPAPAAANGGTFATTLEGALVQGGGPAATSSLAAAAPVSPSPVTGRGAAAMVEIARRELGVTEQPPGSNNSPRIAEYRTATRGAPGPGPWCAYFLSWVARQAGIPIGEQGQGYGAVDSVWAWAGRTGRAAAPGSGYRPKPGDLMVWHGHIGLVERVEGSTVHTIEGNTSNSVKRRTHALSGARGFVKMG